jgi:hypothetical protein
MMITNDVSMLPLVWGLSSEGMISQTMGDMVDSDIRLFTETASHHNQTIADAR